MGTLPDFLIIGAAKSGTTTLYGLLRSHPHVRAAVRRESHFFDRDFEKEVEWYRGHFKPGANKGGRRTIPGESSPPTCRTSGFREGLPRSSPRSG